MTESPVIDISTSVGRRTPVHKLRCAAAQHDPAAAASISLASFINWAAKSPQ